MLAYIDSVYRGQGHAYLHNCILMTILITDLFMCYWVVILTMLLGSNHLTQLTSHSAQWMGGRIQVYTHTHNFTFINMISVSNLSRECTLDGRYSSTEGSSPASRGNMWRDRIAMNSKYLSSLREATAPPALAPERISTDELLQLQIAMHRYVINRDLIHMDFISFFLEYCIVNSTVCNEWFLHAG